MKQYNYKVVGVTFDARDGSNRQASLKKLFQDDLNSQFGRGGHDIKFEGYDFQGADAIAVFVDGKEIGNVPADKVQEVFEIAKKASSCTVTLACNGYDLEEYEDIIDQYKNAKDWKETDPFFDEEAAKEKYDELVERRKSEGEIYSAVLHFFVEEASDKIAPQSTPTKETTRAKEVKPASAGVYYVLFALCIVLLLMSLLLLLAVPVAGLVGVAGGIAGIIYCRKKIKAVKGQNTSAKK